MTASRLNPIAYGLTLGILIGIAIFCLSIVASTFLSGLPISTKIGSLFLTYNSSILSSLVIGGIGLVGGFIGGYIFAWMYNIISELL